MPSFFLFSFLRQGFTLGQAGLAHVVFLLPLTQLSSRMIGTNHTLLHSLLPASTLLGSCRRLKQLPPQLHSPQCLRAHPTITTGCSVQLTLHLSSLPQGTFSQAGAFVLMCPSGEMAPGLCLDEKNDWLQLQLLSVPLSCGHTMLPCTRVMVWRPWTVAH